MSTHALADWLNPHLSTQMLSRFGFKTPHDFLVFLKSPAMKSLETLITKQLDELNFIRVINQQHQRTQTRIKNILLLLLILAYQKKMAVKHRNNKPQLKKPSMLDDTRQAFQAVVRVLVDELASNALLLNEIELAWDALEQDEADYLTDLLNDEDCSLLYPQELVLTLPKKPRILYHDGKFYLLAHGVSFDSLSSESREKAHQAYLKIKPSFETQQKKQNPYQEKKAALLEHVLRIHQDSLALIQAMDRIHTLSDTPMPKHHITITAQSSRLLFKMEACIMTNKPDNTPMLKPFPDTPELLPEQHSFKQGSNHDILMRALTLASINRKRPDFVTATPTVAPTTAPSPFATKPG